MREPADIDLNLLVVFHEVFLERHVSVVARKLVMPNGLIRLPDGSFLTSRDIGAPGRTTRVFPDGHTEVFAPAVTSTNGMAYDAARNVVYIDSTFNPATTISVVDLAHPDSAPRVISLTWSGFHCLVSSGGVLS